MGWIDLFRALGSSLIEVLRAELEALQAEWSRSGNFLVRGLALLAAAFFVLFWTLGALLFAVGAVLAIWLQPWAAALLVTGIFLGLASLLAWLGMRSLSHFENPLASLREHLEDHVDWWQHTLLAESRPLDAAPPAVPPGNRDPRKDLP